MKTTRWLLTLLAFGLLLPSLNAQSVRETFPKITDVKEKETKGRRFVFATINGLKGIIGTEEVLLTELSSAGGVSFEDFADYNELDESARVQPGQVYYFEEKRKTAGTGFHTLAKDQSVWEVAQKYGIRKKFIYKYNRLKTGQSVRPGLVLWLQDKRSKSVAPEYREVPEKEPLWGQKKKTTQRPRVGLPEETPPASDLDAELQEIWQRPDVQESLPPRKRETTTTTTEKEPFTLEEDLFGGEDVDQGMDSGLPSNVLFGETGSTGNTSANPEDRAQQQPTGKKAEKEEYIYHTVQPAESLYMISRMYGVQPQQIQGWNNFKGEPREGEKIIVGIQDGESTAATPTEKEDTSIFGTEPTESWNAGKKETTSDRSTAISAQKEGYIYHTVQPGESLYTISRMYGVDASQIQTWNKLNGMDVSEGMQLIVGEGDAAKADFGDLTSTENDSPFGSTDAGTTDSPFGASTSDAPFMQSDVSKAKAPLFGDAAGIHTVQDGETLWQISRDYNVSVDQLKEWNSLEGDQVNSGSTLYVTADAAPVKALESSPIDTTNPFKEPDTETSAPETATSVEPGTYVIESGDTFWKLEQRFGVTAEQIKEWNGIEQLYAGEKIIVADPSMGQSKGLSGSGTGAVQNSPFPDMGTGETKVTNPSLQQRGLVPPARSAGTGIHVVQPDETTYYIAALYDIRHSQLQAWNHLTDEKLKEVKAGDKLVVSETRFLESGTPVAENTVGQTQYHTAEKGETLFSISQKYGVTLNQLRDWNDKEGTDTVFEGERLIVRK